MKEENRRHKIAMILKEEAEKINAVAIKNLCVFFMVVCVVMTILNIFVHSYRMAVVTGGIGLWMVITLVLSLFIKSPKFPILSALFCMTIGLLYFIVNGGEQGFSVIWIFLLPPISLHFLGLYYGGAFSIIMNIILVVYMWSSLHEFGYDYSDTYRMRLPIVYTVEMVVCGFTRFQIIRADQYQKELLEKANAANRAKGDFLANMSHEIRTPMNAIMGMCELVLGEELKEEVRDNCNNIYLSGKNLLGIINDILDFSKIESGKVKLVCENYQLSSVLNDVINMAMARKEDDRIEFMVDCDPNIPDRLYGDEIRIRQVLVNLLTNAIKFTREGGVLLQVSARQESYGINLQFKVKDSGIGIKNENLEKIFRSFSQVDTKKNRDIEGTGLGLPISKQLVEMMGGFIQVESEYGKGTEFSVVIPQKVVDPTPIIIVQEKEQKKILCYIQFSKMVHPFVKENYRRIIRHIAKRLEVSCTLCDSLEMAKKELESGKGYTHLFLAREEYQSHLDYFNYIAEKKKVTVIQDRNGQIITGKNVRTIYKPFYVLPIGNVLNGESLQFVLGDNKLSLKRFTAPDAKVLVVDDNVVNLKVALGLMKPYCMKMYTAQSGAQALRMVQEQRFDLIFMDHMMAEMDGVEATRKIRALQGEYYQNVPVVALTANAVSGAREMFLSEGFQDFVTKPIELSALERSLKRWLPEELIQREKENEE